MSYSTLSVHASIRGEERLNLSPQSMARLADKALDIGFPRNQFSGSFGRYLDALYFKYRRANNIRIYGEHVYLFHDTTLITLFPVPREYKKVALMAKRKKS